MKRILIRHSVAIASIIISLILSIVIFNLMSRSEIKRAQQEYDFSSQERLKSLSFEFRFRQTALLTIKNIIETQQTINLDQLHKISHSALESYKLSSICFTNSLNETVLALGEYADHCKDFDITQTSKILSGDKIKIMSSVAVVSNSTIKGYLTFVFDLDSLRDQNALPSMHEYLVSQNPSSLLLTLYDLNGRAVPPSETVNFARFKTSYFDLLHIDEFSLFYVTAINAKLFSAESKYSILLLSVLVFLLGSLSGYFIQLLGAQKKIISAEVKVRTEELNQFAYRTSHDLKSPLTTIKGLAKFSILDLQNRNLDEAKSNLERIILQSEKLEKLVTDILNIARSDLADVEIETVELRSYLNNLTNLYSHQVDVFGLSIRHNIDSEVKVKIPRLRLDQIFDNLITNAIKYRKQNESPNIIIDMNVHTSHLSVRFQDFGVGFPSERIGEVFRPFKRFHPRMAEGNGLGLSIVKRNIDKLGGTIQLASNASGSTFLFSIPLRNESSK